MRWFLILLFLSMPAQAEYCYARIGLGHSWSNLDWENQDSIGGGYGVGCRHQLFDSKWYGDLSLSHYSQPFVGNPVNNDRETGSSHAFYWVEWRF